MTLRALTTSDAAAFLKLRLFGLQESPSAFGSSYEEEKDCTIAQIQERLTGSKERVFFGAFQENELVGMVGVGREQGQKQRHLAFVRSMYVAPNARSKGVGKALLFAAIQQARAWNGVEQITLAVNATNKFAIDLYRRALFVEVGRMPRALRISDSFFDELNMVHHIGATAIENPDLDAVIAEHFAAIASRDIDAFTSHLCDAETLYTIIQNGHAFTTRQESIELHKQWFKDPNWIWEGSVVHKIVGEEVAMALIKYQYRAKREDTPVDSWLTFVFQIQNGYWRIAHDHNTALDYAAFARMAGIKIQVP